MNAGVALTTVLLLLAAGPAVAAADETRAGGTVVIEADEVVDGDLTVRGGTVIVEGTIEGDLAAFAGNVFVSGTVDGDVDAVAGNVHVNGTIGGDLGAVGGNLIVEPGAEIGGALDAAGGSVTVDGAVGGDVSVGAGAIAVGSTAVVGGDLAYAGELAIDPDARIDGTVRREAFAIDRGPLVPGWLLSIYGLAASLLLGAVLLALFPTFSRGVAGRVTADPLRTGATGLFLLVGVPLLLAALLVTVVGIPLALLGGLAFAVLLWVGAVYGGFAVGTWLLSLAERDELWLALAVGLVAVALAVRIPVVGGLIRFLVLLVGFGALATGLYDRYRNRPAAPVAGATEPDDCATVDESRSA